MARTISSKGRWSAFTCTPRSQQIDGQMRQKVDSGGHRLKSRTYQHADALQVVLAQVQDSGPRAHERGDRLCTRQFVGVHVLRGTSRRTALHSAWQGTRSFPPRSDSYLIARAGVACESLLVTSVSGARIISRSTRGRMCARACGVSSIATSAHASIVVCSGAACSMAPSSWCKPANMPSIVGQL